MSMPLDVSFKTDGGRFNLRTTAIILCGAQVLTMKTDTCPYYYTPGGRVHLNESSKEALRRELGEELGVRLEPERLLWVCESFFIEETTEERFHETGFYYLITLPRTHELCREASFSRRDDRGEVQYFHWQPLSGLAEVDLRPAWLKEEMQCLPLTTKHILDER